MRLRSVVIETLESKTEHVVPVMSFSSLCSCVHAEHATSIENRAVT